jgi:hypothetical protein
MPVVRVSTRGCEGPRLRVACRPVRPRGGRRDVDDLRPRELRKLGFELYAIAVGG